MARNIRYIVPGKLYEVTLKTFQARYFFVPSKRMNEIVIGVLAYAQKKYGLKICAIHFMSNHVHILVLPESAQQLADFLCLAKSQIAKEVQRLCGWEGGIFDERSIVTPITDEPEAQVERLRYVLAQGLKEGLVPHPTDWPGIESMTPLLNGSLELNGVWVRRSELYEKERGDSRRKPKFIRTWHNRKKYKAFTDKLVLKLSPIPCWSHLDHKQIAQRARAICDELLHTYRDIRQRVHRDFCRRLTNPDLMTHRPKGTKKGVQPQVFALTKEQWLIHIKKWEAWSTQYERASARLRNGIVEALNEFPEGAFIPSGVAFRAKRARAPG